MELTKGLTRELHELVAARALRQVVWDVGLGELAVVDTMEIHIQTLSSASFKVTIDSTDTSVMSMKRAIQDSQGTRTYLQDLFLLPAANEGGSEDKGEMKDNDTLKDDGNIAGPCSVLLCVKTETGFDFFLSFLVSSFCPLTFVLFIL